MVFSDILFDLYTDIQWPLYFLINLIETDYRCGQANGFQINAKQLFSSPLFNLNNNKYHRTLYIWTEYCNMAQIGTLKL